MLTPSNRDGVARTLTSQQTATHQCAATGLHASVPMAIRSQCNSLSPWDNVFPFSDKRQPDRKLVHMIVLIKVQSYQLHPATLHALSPPELSLSGSYCTTSSSSSAALFSALFLKSVMTRVGSSGLYLCFFRSNVITSKPSQAQ